MNPESINYLFEVGIDGKQEDYIWPVAGKANVYDRVFIVCDGTGSFHNGGIASKLICQYMAVKVLKFTEHKMSGELIDKLLIKARDRLIAYARENRLDTDLATTFLMLILYNQKALISWCGDSRIYHLRRGEILFKTEDNARNAAGAGGIKADSSPIYAGTKWIKDVRDGDYFLLSSKGLIENVSDADIKSLISQSDKTNIELTASFKQLALEKTLDNYSMYLIRVKTGTPKKRSIKDEIIAIREQSREMVSPLSILAITVVGLLIMVFYFRKARTSGPAPKYINQTTQPVNAVRNDSVPSAIVMSAPRKPVLPVTDSVKNNSENPQIPQDDNSAAIQANEEPDQTNQTPISQKKREAQLSIRFTTDESCKLKITNIDLDEVIDWDLTQDDNGIIFLKPGKYSIVATSVVNSSKTKTYNFDVKPAKAHATQNIHIGFR